MRETRILWKLFPSYLAVVVLALIAAVWFAAHTTEELFATNVESELAQRARLIEADVVPLVTARDFAGLERLCKERGASAAMRVTVILPDGQVAADSDEDPSAMGNHKGRIEVAEALAGHVGSAVHYSQTLHRDMMYVALPILEAGALRCVLRMSVPLIFVGEALRPFLIHVVWGGIVIAAIAGVIALVIARRISAPLQELRRGAERFAQGDFSVRLPHSVITEIERVASALNGMAAELDGRIGTIISQRNELEAILSSMNEGVLAVGSDGRILRVNEAAASMLGLDPKEVHLRPIREAVGNPSLQMMVEQALASEQPVETEMVLDLHGEHFIQAHGAALRDSQGAREGVVVVLNDVTRLRRLENLRREFVANVSHEFRTPITAIKGFVETLQDGAIASPEEGARFLGIIAKQVDHLSAVINDLLLLSRFDEVGDNATIPKEEHLVQDVIESAVQVCGRKADEKRVKVVTECAGDLRGVYNAPLIEQALVNLIDNAVKFSEAGTTVVLSAGVHGEELVFRVTDQGCGVSGDHLPRLFERFYRVDKARSRKLGGTGLGLAIVKHIAKVHGGRASAESVAGKGSTFTISLPLAGAA
jgi:two-component system, OmpR family, phosphate regulon sensor histidine kinase PhoR